MSAVVGPLLGALAAMAVLMALHPGPAPRRFPEELEHSHDPRRDRGTGRPAVGARRVAEPADLAECCDLLAVAAASGLTVAESVRVVGAVGAGQVGSFLRSVANDVHDGELVAESLGRRGAAVAPPVRPLVTTLLTTVVSGAPAAPSLQRLADAERRRSRRQVESRIRRLPVLLLLPLVGLVLPAFVILTLVPVGLAAAQGADLSAGPTPVESTSSPPPSPMRQPNRTLGARP